MSNRLVNLSFTTTFPTPLICAECASNSIKEKASKSRQHRLKRFRHERRCRSQNRHEKCPTSGRSRAGGFRRIVAAGAVLGAALLPPAWQTAQVAPRRSLFLWLEPRGHRRALVRLHHTRCECEPHAG